MEQFRQIGEALGSMKALMVLQDGIRLNKRQCGLLFDMFNIAFDTLSEEIKKNLKIEERNKKWKSTEQPLKELYRVFREGESYLKLCFDSSKENWWVKAITYSGNRDSIEFHIHNLLCYFPIAIEAIESAGEISGLDLDEMKRRRVAMSNKYDKTWNDPKLFQWKYGKQYLVSQDICQRLKHAWKEDQWLMLETMGEMKSLPLSKQEQHNSDLLMNKLSGSDSSLYPTSVLTGAKDYQIRRRLGGGRQYREIQWLGESFATRHFFVEHSSLTSDILRLISLSHPNIIQHLFGFHDEEKKEYLLVMELMSKDLNSYVKEVCGPKRRLPFSLPAAVDIMLQIARGMEYLHSQMIFHGHLKPSNILIKPRSTSSQEGYFLAKVSGFGLRGAKAIPSRTSSPNQDEALPFIWHAPEVLDEQERPGNSSKHKYSEKADVYSFGMLCFELLTGKVPFEDLHLQGDKMSRNIRAGERPLFPFALPKYLATVTKRCWQTDPNQRPSFSSICRILRYVKRLITLNPHLAHPEIPSVNQVDFCEIEVSFMKMFQVETTMDVTSVSQIPFQLFAYRLADREKISGSNTEKNWESQSDMVISSHLDHDNVNKVEDSRSVCSETPTKRVSIMKKVDRPAFDDTLTVCIENPAKKLLPLRKSKSTSASRSPLLIRDAKPLSSEIPEKKPSPLKKINTIPVSSDTSSEITEKKVHEKNISILRKSKSSRVSKDSGKPKWQAKGPTLLGSRSQSARTNAERYKYKPKHADPSTESQNQ